MKIDHRNIYTPTELSKGGISKVIESIKKNAAEIFVVRSSRSDEEMAIMSVERAEHLLHLEEILDRYVDAQILQEFEERKVLGFEPVDFEPDPSIQLSEEERYIPRSKRQKAGAL